ncbi:MAG: hypothetical protein ABII12_16035 [Planctomycetota bacterium]
MPAAEDMRRTARRIYCWPLAGWLALMLVGYLPTRWKAGPGGLEAMLVGQAVVVAVVCGTLYPTMRRMVKSDAKRRLQMGLAAGVVRLLVTAAIAAVVLWSDVVDPAVFLLWVGIAYIVMIGVETQAIIKWGKELGSQT